MTTQSNENKISYLLHNELQELLEANKNEEISLIIKSALKLAEINENEVLDVTSQIQTLVNDCKSHIEKTAEKASLKLFDPLLKIINLMLSTQKEIFYAEENEFLAFSLIDLYFKIFLLSYKYDKQKYANELDSTSYHMPYNDIQKLENFVFTKYSDPEDPYLTLDNAPHVFELLNNWSKINEFYVYKNLEENPILLYLELITTRPLFLKVDSDYFYQVLEVLKNLVLKIDHITVQQKRLIDETYNYVLSREGTEGCAFILTNEMPDKETELFKECREAYFIIPAENQFRSTTGNESPWSTKGEELRLSPFGNPHCFVPVASHGVLFDKIIYRNLNTDEFIPCSLDEKAQEEYQQFLKNTSPNTWKQLTRRELDKFSSFLNRRHIGGSYSLDLVAIGLIWLLRTESNYHEVAISINSFILKLDLKKITANECSWLIKVCYEFAICESIPIRTLFCKLTSEIISQDRLTQSNLSEKYTIQSLKQMIAINKKLRYDSESSNEEEYIIYYERELNLLNQLNSMRGTEVSASDWHHYAMGYKVLARKLTNKNNNKALSFYNKAYEIIKNSFEHRKKNKPASYIYYYEKMLLAELLLLMGQLEKCPYEPKIIINSVLKIITDLSPIVLDFYPNNQSSNKKQNKNSLVKVDETNVVPFYEFVSLEMNPNASLQDKYNYYRTLLSASFIFCCIEFCVYTNKANLVNPTTNVSYEKEALELAMPLFFNVFDASNKGADNKLIYQVPNLCFRYIGLNLDTQVKLKKNPLMGNALKLINNFLDSQLCLSTSVSTEFTEFTTKLLVFVIDHEKLLQEKIESPIFNKTLQILGKVFKSNEKQKNKKEAVDLNQLKLSLTKIRQELKVSENTNEEKREAEIITAEKTEIEKNLTLENNPIEKADTEENANFPLPETNTFAKSHEIQNSYPLHTAVLANKLSDIQQLLETNKNNVDFINQKHPAYGTTAICLSAKMGNIAIVECFLKYKAKVNIANDYNCHILLWICLCADKEKRLTLAQLFLKQISLFDDGVTKEHILAIMGKYTVEGKKANILPLWRCHDLLKPVVYAILQSEPADYLLNKVDESYLNYMNAKVKVKGNTLNETEKELCYAVILSYMHIGHKGMASVKPSEIQVPVTYYHKASSLVVTMEEKFGNNKFPPYLPHEYFIQYFNLAKFYLNYNKTQEVLTAFIKMFDLVKNIKNKLTDKEIAPEWHALYEEARQQFQHFVSTLKDETTTQQVDQVVNLLYECGFAVDVRGSMSEEVFAILQSAIKISQESNDANILPSELQEILDNCKQHLEKMEDKASIQHFTPFLTVISLFLRAQEDLFFAENNELLAFSLVDLFLKISLLSFEKDQRKNTLKIKDIFLEKYELVEALEKFLLMKYKNNADSFLTLDKAPHIFELLKNWIQLNEFIDYEIPELNPVLDYLNLIVSHPVFLEVDIDYFYFVADVLKKYLVLNRYLSNDSVRLFEKVKDYVLAKEGSAGCCMILTNEIPNENTELFENCKEAYFIIQNENKIIYRNIIIDEFIVCSMDEKFHEDYQKFIAAYSIGQWNKLTRAQLEKFASFLNRRHVAGSYGLDFIEIIIAFFTKTLSNYKETAAHIESFFIHWDISKFTVNERLKLVKLCFDMGNDETFPEIQPLFYKLTSANFSKDLLFEAESNEDYRIATLEHMIQVNKKLRLQYEKTNEDESSLYFLRELDLMFHLYEIPTYQKKKNTYDWYQCAMGYKKLADKAAANSKNDGATLDLYNKAYTAIKKSYGSQREETDNYISIYERLLLAELLLRMSKFDKFKFPREEITKFVFKVITETKDTALNLFVNHQPSNKKKNNKAVSASDKDKLVSFYRFIHSDLKATDDSQEARALYNERVSTILVFSYIEFCLYANKLNLINPNTNILYEKEVLNIAMPFFIKFYSALFKSSIENEGIQKILLLSCRFIEFSWNKEINSEMTALIDDTFKKLINVFLEYQLKSSLPISSEVLEFLTKMIGFMMINKELLKKKLGVYFFDTTLDLMEQVIKSDKQKKIDQELVDQLNQLKLFLTPPEEDKRKPKNNNTEEAKKAARQKELEKKEADRKLVLQREAEMRKLQEEAAKQEEAKKREAEKRRLQEKAAKQKETEKRKLQEKAKQDEAKQRKLEKRKLQEKAEQDKAKQRKLEKELAKKEAADKLLAEKLTAELSIEKHALENNLDEIQVEGKGIEKNVEEEIETPDKVLKVEIAEENVMPEKTLKDKITDEIVKTEIPTYAEIVPEESSRWRKIKNLKISDEKLAFFSNYLISHEQAAMQNEIAIELTILRSRSVSATPAMVSTRIQESPLAQDQCQFFSNIFLKLGKRELKHILLSCLKNSFDTENQRSLQEHLITAVEDMLNKLLLATELTLKEESSLSSKFVVASEYLKTANFALPIWENEVFHKECFYYNDLKSHPTLKEDSKKTINDELKKELKNAEAKNIKSHLSNQESNSNIKILERGNPLLVKPVTQNHSPFWKPVQSSNEASSTSTHIDNDYQQNKKGS